MKKKKKDFDVKIKKSLLYLIFVVLLMIFISLLYIITLIVTHYESFDKNPLLFGAEKYSINSCSCVNDGGISFNFNKDKIYTENYKPESNNLILSQESLNKIVIK